MTMLPPTDNFPDTSHQVQPASSHGPLLFGATKYHQNSSARQPAQLEKSVSLTKVRLLVNHLPRWIFNFLLFPRFKPIYFPL